MIVLVYFKAKPVTLVRPSSSILCSPWTQKICKDAYINIILKYCLFNYLRYLFSNLLI